MEEKIYRFKKYNSGLSGAVNEEVKESELTQAHKDLLYGEVVNSFNNLSGYLQLKFLQEAYDKIYEENITKRSKLIAKEISENLTKSLNKTEE